MVCWHAQCVAVLPACVISHVQCRSSNISSSTRALQTPAATNLQECKILRRPQQQTVSFPNHPHQALLQELHPWKPDQLYNSRAGSYRAAEMYQLIFALPLETRWTHEYLIWKRLNVAAGLAQTEQQKCTRSDVHSVQELDNEHMSTASCPANLKMGQLSEGPWGRCWAKCRKAGRAVPRNIKSGLRLVQLH